MITITFPDNTVKEFESGITGLEIAKGISNRLAKEAVAVGVNGETYDLTRPIIEDAEFAIYKFTDEQGKDAFWHSSAHLMAEALEVIYPGVKLWVGPSVDNGFYYDIDLPEGQTITDKDFPKIEKKMLELAQQKNAYIRKDMAKGDALKYYSEKGDEYKVDLISGLEDGTITFYEQGNFTDLCRGPHLPNTGYIKAMKIISN